MLDRLRKFFRLRRSTPPIETITFLPYTKDYAGPFHVWSCEPAASCVRLSDGRLHVYQQGNFPDLFHGHEYILASRAIARALQASCGSSVTIVPAQVVNVATGERLAHDHFEVTPHEEIRLETGETVDATGGRAWHFRKSDLFVTKQVVLELQRAGFESLQCTPGFSAFCGDVTSG